MDHSLASAPDRLTHELATLRAEVDRFDAAGRFPPEAVAMFERTGLLAAPLPVDFGGLGLGTEPDGSTMLVDTLRRLGAAWLPLARVFEGHVNALRLIFRYGAPSQRQRAAGDAPSHLFAIWAAEARPVMLDQGRLHGKKSFASAAGAVTRPVLTAMLDGHERLVWLRFPPGDERIIGKPDLSGMRGAGTSALTLDGLAVTDDDLIGGPDDYMRQPEISLGSWRALPGLLGGLQALTEIAAGELRRLGRAGEPLQLARYGQMLLSCETAAMWVDRVAFAAEADDAGDDAAYLVKLARHAIDQACSIVLDHARRAVGLASFVRPHAVERLCRDIDTYRRQPALDEVLLEAARYRLDHQ